MGRRISYRDILRHRANGRSIREIAAACSCSSSAVQDILAGAEENDVGWDDVAVVYLTTICDRTCRILTRPCPDNTWCPCVRTWDSFHSSTLHHRRFRPAGRQ